MAWVAWKCLSLPINIEGTQGWAADIGTRVKYLRLCGMSQKLTAQAHYRMDISSFFLCAIKKAETNAWTNFINNVSNLFNMLLHFQLVLMSKAM